MNVSEKLLLLGNFTETGETFTISGCAGYFKFGKSFPIVDFPKYIEMQYQYNGSEWWRSKFDFNDLLRREIKPVPKLPKLTDEEKDFLKWFRDDYYIARDKLYDKLCVYEIKPFKKFPQAWGCDKSFAYYELSNNPYSFESIKWSDEDCYTIGELRK